MAELEAIQESAIKTVISDPVANRHLEKLEPAPQAVVRRARRAVKSKYGKALLRRRGMHIERSFAHILDSGGMRRATLRGQENLDKRYKIAAATYNLSQLMRYLFGVGTAKQAAAGIMKKLIKLLFDNLPAFISDVFDRNIRLPFRLSGLFLHFPKPTPHSAKNHGFFNRLLGSFPSIRSGEEAHILTELGIARCRNLHELAFLSSSFRRCQDMTQI